MDPADTARERVLDDHRETVGAVLESARVAAATVDEPATREGVTAALEAAMDDALRAALVDLLRGAVAATGRDLFAEPVPASPYVVITARGPLVRATLADGRLVVLVRTFRREAEGYVHATVDPEDSVESWFRRSP